MINKSVLIRLVSLYVIPYLLLLTAILVMMYIYPKPELHLMLNSFHSGVLDFFLKILYPDGGVALVCPGFPALVVEAQQDDAFLCDV